MFWAWDITITAGTTATSPKEQILKLTKGIITKIDIYFPKGCNGYVKVKLLRSEFQLVPLSRGEWVTGNGETIPTETYYELEETPSQLKFIGISPDAKYDHTVTVRVQILPKEVATPYIVVREFVSLFKRLIGA